MFQFVELLPSNFASRQRALKDFQRIGPGLKMTAGPYRPGRDAMAQVEKQIQPTDACARCGLQQATRELEARGVSIRLCDDCYWGKEPILSDLRD